MALEKDFISNNLLTRLREQERRLAILERRLANLPDLRNRDVIASAAADEPVYTPLGAFTNSSQSDYFLTADKPTYEDGLLSTRLFLLDAGSDHWWQLLVREVNGIPRLFMRRVSATEVR